MTTTAKAKHGPEFGRQRLPERFCNLDRLLADMEARELDGLVVTTPLNVFWLTSFNGIAHKADEPRPYVVILARREPEHPVMVLADYYLTTPLHQPTWVRGHPAVPVGDGGHGPPAAGGTTSTPTFRGRRPGSSGWSGRGPPTGSISPSRCGPR